MGKKKVAKQTGEEVLKEREQMESAMAKAATSGAGSGKKLERVRVYVNASYNNTVITVADKKGDVLAWSSAGSLGFSGPKKATPFAASKVAAAIAEKIKKAGPVNMDIIVKGVGSGRDAAVRALAGQGYNIVTLRDDTPLPHNGPQPKKKRRI